MGSRLGLHHRSPERRRPGGRLQQEIMRAWFKAVVVRWSRRRVKRSNKLAKLRFLGWGDRAVITH